MSISISDKSKICSLYDYIKNGNLDNIKKLNLNSENVNYRNLHDSTPLHMASILGKLDIVKFLVGKGADINHIDKGYNSALDHAIRNQRFEVAQYLIENLRIVNFQWFIF